MTVYVIIEKHLKSLFIKFYIFAKYFGCLENKIDHLYKMLSNKEAQKRIEADQSDAKDESSSVAKRQIQTTEVS